MEVSGCLSAPLAHSTEKEHARTEEEEEILELIEKSEVQERAVEPSQVLVTIHELLCYG